MTRRCSRTGKQCHKSKGAADAHLRSLLKLDAPDEPEILSTFICRFCESWHVGHNEMKRAVTPMPVQPKMKRGPGLNQKAEVFVDTKRRLEILASLGSGICACGAKKRPKKSHCRRCYFALPPQMRQALYQRFGEGYEEAYEASLELLAGKVAQTQLEVQRT